MAIASVTAFSPAHAWGDHGHRAIVDIAWTQMSGTAKREVRALLEAAPDLATPACRVGSLEDGATWADCVRSRYKERFYSTSSWHYVNVSICRSFRLPPDPDARFVVARLGREIATLRDRTKPRVVRLEALLWVAHLTGDVHQPLHVGDAGDRGGNQVSVYPQTGRYPINLHSEWDRNLADDAIDAAPGGVAGLALAASDSSKKHGWQAGTPPAWARESWDVARRVAYSGTSDRCHGGGGEIEVGDRYEAAAVPVVQAQLERAGVRLAAILNKILR